MASEPIECQVLVLRVSIHCEGCKKKVKKVLQSVHGVLRCDIDARSNKVVVTASTKLDPNILVAKLRKSGKQAEPWPEPPMPQQPPAESQSEETKSQNDEPSKPAEKPGPDNAEPSGAEQSNPQPSPEPKQSNAGEAPKPAPESKEASNGDADANAGDEATAAAQQPQPSDRRGKAKQQPEERHPVHARVRMEYDPRGGDSYMPATQPVPIMSYHTARPSASASYYAAPPAPAPAPAPMPMPMGRAPGPSQGYIDEQYTPSYYGRSSSPYEPYYPPQPSPYYPPQPSPYRYQYQPAASTEDYYYSAPPQRSAFSPPRDGYGDMFNDENANSCAVM
ncbi:hypothetical protein EJB05_16501 [Eragrostis curvula]|uniref:HMA domain-containing protein n=1 Tax=Eragrostis curvula TaxID=38414 RepID=A0A5J9VG41_9POAL|nr:hypothetical protein EJB05_16501 [Eragrostis curvula]